MTPQAQSGPVKNIRIPKSDVDAAMNVAPPRFAVTDNARRFAVMGAAILEKLCRSGRLKVHARRTTPYILDTARGRTAVSVMVSTVSGSLATKHMIVPLTSLRPPPGAERHVLVCAFTSKRERTRESRGGLNVVLAGWATAEEAAGYARAATRVATPVKISAVPVSALHPIQTLRHYLAPATGGDHLTQAKKESEHEETMPRMRA